MKYSDISALVGLTIKNIQASDDLIEIKTEDGREFQMYHDQDCCESVYLEDITEDYKDILEGCIVQTAYESRDDLGPKSDYEESYTWTFYRIRTWKGTVVIRWYGSSNGYYSETASFYEV